MPVQGRVTKWILWSLTGLLLVSGMVVASLSSDHSAWQGAQRWAVEREQCWQQDGCPVVAGEPQPGCSRADHRAAALLAAALPEAMRDRLQELAEDAAAPLPDTAMLEAAAPLVELLRASARRQDDVDPGEARFGPDAITDPVDVFALRAALAALQLAARDLGARRPQAALELLRDGIVVGADLGAAGTGVERLVGQLAIVGFTGELRDEWLRACDRETLGSLAAAARAAAAAMPPPFDFLERELVHKIAFVEHAQSLGWSDVGVRGVLPVVRHGFSARSYAIAQLCGQLALLREARALAPAGSGCTVWRAAAARFASGLRRMPRDYLAMPQNDEPERAARSAEAALIQLRQAVAFHLGKPVPVLPDPLGDGPMRVAIDGESATITSAEPGIGRAAVRRGR